MIPGTSPLLSFPQFGREVVFPLKTAEFRWLLLAEVLTEDFGQLEHADGFGSEHPLQFFVRQDLALVIWILQVVLLDVRPSSLNDFSSGQWLLPTIWARSAEGSIGFMSAGFSFFSVVVVISPPETPQ